MLIYHPAFDTYSAVFRISASLGQITRGKNTTLERIRILDFYLLFPSTLQGVTVPRNAIGLRRRVTTDINDYNKVQDPRRIFARLEPFQLSALNYLAARGIVNPDSLQNGKVERTSVSLPPEIERLVNESNEIDNDLISLLTGAFRTVDLYGSSGLKARTHLFEHRYDPT